MKKKMINFINDQLVPPVLCEILYHTVPDDWHIPVVFLTRPGFDEADRFYSLGAHSGMAPKHIEIYLEDIFDEAMRRRRIEFGVSLFRIWYLLLHTCYHEFAHEGDPYLNALAEGAYGAGGMEYENAEAIANRYGNLSIAQLADWDKRLYQPRWLGYLSIRTDYHIARPKKWRSLVRRWGRADLLGTLRCAKSGGQLTTSDVVVCFDLLQESWEEDQLPSTAQIRRVASDLAHEYVDRAGRQHLLFDFGDLPEIRRRIGKVGTRRRASMDREAYPKAAPLTVL